MKSWISGMLMALVLSAPLTVGQQVSTNTDIQTVSTVGLGFRQIGEAFGDFVFRIRAALTFDGDAKLDLLKARNDEMKTRQRVWLEIKNNLTEQLKSDNMTAEEKRQVIKYLIAEHEAIIREHLRLTADMWNVQLKARADKHNEIERSARIEAEYAERSSLSSGLNISGEVELNIGVNGDLTAGQAKALAQERLGFHATDIRTETRNGATFYVVSGSENSTAGNYTLKKGFEMWVRTNTGTIESLDLNARLDSRSEVSV
ncbi:MAG: hypothetical protein HYT71_03880 [Candidatus Aenigmarchaeota archaeon]|nr:hypothetical protein [Candidatus Aenigmarchaeota archaeon]